jgi:hypothetical protein
MTSEEKSKEILRQFNFAGLHNGRKVYGFALDGMKQIARWKRDQMIKKACEWLKDNIDDYYSVGDGGDEFDGYFDEMIVDFKKAMEGGEE